MGYKRTIGILLAVILMMVSGCSSKKTVLPLEETVKLTEEQLKEESDVSETDPLQLENQLSIQILDDGQEAGENWDARVAEAIISENQGMYAQGECVAEGHMILETEQKETETKLYVLTMYGEYQFQNGNFVKEAGSGVIPAVLVFQRGEGDEHILSSYEVPEDGNGYVESIQKLFPKHLQEICISPTEEVRDALKDQERRYASEYLEVLGRTAKIGDYRDFEYPLLTDAGVSVEVSNRMVENKELGVYPYWIGSEERLEDGVRYVYQMDYDPEKKQILYTKTEYDTGAVKETYIFNSETGEPES